MKRLALLVFVAACTNEGAQLDRARLQPAGSRLTGSLDVCFEHETPAGWERIGLVDATGRHAVTYAAFKGRWFFPADAGKVSIVPCSEIR